MSLRRYSPTWRAKPRICPAELSFLAGCIRQLALPGRRQSEASKGGVLANGRLILCKNLQPKPHKNGKGFVQFSTQRWANWTEKSVTRFSCTILSKRAFAMLGPHSV